MNFLFFVSLIYPYIYIPFWKGAEKSMDIDLSQVINIVVAVVPLIVVVAILKMLMNLFKGFS